MIQITEEQHAVHQQLVAVAYLAIRSVAAVPLARACGPDRKIDGVMRVIETERALREAVLALPAEVLRAAVLGDRDGGTVVA